MVLVKLTSFGPQLADAVQRGVAVGDGLVRRRRDFFGRRFKRRHGDDGIIFRRALLKRRQRIGGGGERAFFSWCCNRSTPPSAAKERHFQNISQQAKGRRNIQAESRSIPAPGANQVSDIVHEHRGFSPVLDSKSNLFKPFQRVPDPTV